MTIHLLKNTRVITVYTGSIYAAVTETKRGWLKCLRDNGYGLVYHAVCLFTPPSSLPTFPSSKFLKHDHSFAQRHKGNYCLDWQYLCSSNRNWTRLVVVSNSERSQKMA